MSRHSREAHAAIEYGSFSGSLVTETSDDLGGAVNQRRGQRWWWRWALKHQQVRLHRRLPRPQRSSRPQAEIILVQALSRVGETELLVQRMLALLRKS